MLGCVLGAAWLTAQEPAGDPFGDSKPVEKPAAAPTKKAPAAKVETDPIVLGIRDSQPRTGSELLQAAINLINYGRPDEAKRYLAALSGLALTDEQAWRLQRQFGSAPLLRMTLQADLQPVGKQVADKLQSGAQKFIHDPARIAQLIERLGSGTADERRSALVDLRETEADGVVALVMVLGDSARAADHPRIRATLTALGAVSVEPLLAALENPDESWKSQIVMVLASLGRTEAVPFLLRPYFLAEADSPQKLAAQSALSQLLPSLPTQAEAERYLLNELREYFHGRLPGKVDENGQLRLWRWDAAQRRPVEQRLTPVIASLQFASRLGAELTTLAPTNRSYRAWYLAAVLETARLATDWETPLALGPAGHLPAMVTPADLDLMEDVLRLATQEGHPSAAVGALDLIGGSENLKWLESSSGQPRATVLALRHSNRRVRFAAVRAIVRLAPPAPFAGASLVPESLAYFARSAGTRRVLIAHPRTGDAQTIAGKLREFGFESDVLPTGRAALQEARRNADYEFVLLSDGLDRPDVVEQIQQFRQDSLTAKLPIGVLARTERFDILNLRLEREPMTRVFYQSTDSEGIQFVTTQMLRLLDGNFVAHAERLGQARQSLAWWTEMLARPEWFGYLEFLPHQDAAEVAVRSPATSELAARVLGLLADTASQRALVTLASDHGEPLPARRAAVAGLSVAIGRRGILLTQTEVLRQFDLYNRSATADPDTQQVLGAVLDALEQMNPEEKSPTATTAEETKP